MKSSGRSSITAGFLSETRATLALGSGLAIDSRNSAGSRARAAFTREAARDRRDVLVTLKRAPGSACPSMTLEILDVTLVLLGGFTRAKRAEIAAPTGLPIELLGIEPIATRNFSDHAVRARKIPAGMMSTERWFEGATAGARRERDERTVPADDAAPAQSQLAAKPRYTCPSAVGDPSSATSFAFGIGSALNHE